MISDFVMNLIKFGIGVFGASVVVFKLYEFGYLDTFIKKKKGQDPSKKTENDNNGNDDNETQARILRHEGYDPVSKTHIYTVIVKDGLRKNRIVQIEINDISPVQRFKKKDVILFWDELGLTRATLKTAFDEDLKHYRAWP